MTNETKTSRRQIAIGTLALLVGLSMLLIPGVPQAVAQVPASITTAGTWAVDTFVAVWNWIF